MYNSPENCLKWVHANILQLILIYTQLKIHVIKEVKMVTHKS